MLNTQIQTWIELLDRIRSESLKGVVSLSGWDYDYLSELTDWLESQNPPSATQEKKMDVGALEQIYNEVSTGTTAPDYIEYVIPGIGFVQITNRGICLVNHQDATPQQTQAIAEYFRKCTSPTRSGV